MSDPRGTTGVVHDDPVQLSLLVRQGLLEEGQAFLRKPFSAQALGEAIRVCLGT